MNIAELLHRQAISHPDARALISGRGRGKRTVTLGALDGEAARIAALLHRMGVGKNDVALILQPLSVELYAVLFAVIRLGAIAMFPDPAARRADIAAACAAMPPKILIASPRAHLLRFVVPAVRDIPLKLSTGTGVRGAASLTSAADFAPYPHIAPCSEKDSALVTFTSGSTGVPKGMVRTHGLLSAQHRALASVMGGASDRVDMTTLPLFVLCSLADGVPCVLPDADLKRPGTVKPGPILRQMEEHRVTRMIASPALLERLMERRNESDKAFAHLTEIFTGGGPVFPDLLQNLSVAAPEAKVSAVYGSTEAEPIAHCDSAPSGGQGLLAGAIVPELQLAILPDHFGSPIGPFAAEDFAGAQLAAERIGEIVVSGPRVVESYVDANQNSSTKFKVGNEIWHRTGDAGYRDRSGRLWLVGRCEGRIADRHGTIYPLEVEAVARAAIGACRLACVSAAGVRTLLIEGRDKGVNVEALSRALESSHIGEIRFVRRIPVDRRHNSKVDYARLRAMLAPGAARAAPEPA
jgi:acyl-CoA synthetase (AMP-forming)/AMP-acid ligase II